jgi:hypothetical protein
MKSLSQSNLMNSNGRSLMNIARRPYVTPQAQQATQKAFSIHIDPR